uniref:Dolichyl-diphosphooligosaccharide--protein glycosyltransferase subunit 1 n=1 Tax=Rhabditophanes sp. KR3021 TaxID=114890 RepID=A0AC35TNX9_9BILA
MFKSFIVASILAVAVLCAGLDISVSRTVDITSQIAKNSIVYTIKNTGQDELKEFIQPIPEAEYLHLAHIYATIDGKSKLKVNEKKDAQISAGFKGYAVTFSKPIASGETEKLTVEYKVTQFLTPFPAEIKQADNQFVLYKGSAVTPSAYLLTKDTTTYKVPGGKVPVFTAVAPSKQSSGKIVYGSYDKVAAFDKKDITIHYENNSPFLVVTELTRWIEVSHWGNIAVEDTLEIVHQGAKLVGGFSRLDYQQDRRRTGQPSVHAYTTQLPSGARDIYYRDQIGNVSTSEVLVRSKSVDVEIRPRFPLFGGWKTDYTFGYNIPSATGVFSRGNGAYTLKVPIVDKLYDNFVIQKLTVKVVLPERSSNIKLKTPFPMKQHPSEVHKTYIDTVGRPVTVFSMNNVIDSHAQNFSITYNFDSSAMMIDFAILCSVFFAIFFVIILLNRINLSIGSDAKKDL